MLGNRYEMERCGCAVDCLDAYEKLRCVSQKRKRMQDFDDADLTGQSTSSELRRCHRLLPEAGSRAAARINFIPSATATFRAESETALAVAYNHRNDEICLLRPTGCNSAQAPSQSSRVPCIWQSE